MAEPREIIARTLCKCGGYDNSQGTCAAICMGQLGDARAGPHGCAEAVRVHGKRADAILAALAAEGWAVVPREPTEAMVEAGDEICPVARGTESHKMAGGVVPEHYWRAMIAAAEKESSDG